jgi:NAD(P)-dependent dehydrogenase (short-subunit alcohol dehydrogenase family)
MADNSRVILITGSDSGIGLAIARKFAMKGYRIAMCGADRRKGERARQITGGVLVVDGGVTAGRPRLA